MLVPQQTHGVAKNFITMITRWYIDIIEQVFPGTGVPGVVYSAFHQVLNLYNLISTADEVTGIV